MADHIRILQIGCGNMGGALLNAWLQAGLLEARDLPAHEKVEGYLGHEEGLARAVGIADGRADVVVREPVERVHGLKAPAEDLREDVADARAAVELVHLDAVGEAPFALHGVLEVGRVVREEAQQDAPEVAAVHGLGGHPKCLNLLVDVNHHTSDSILNVR